MHMFHFHTMHMCVWQNLHLMGNHFNFTTLSSFNFPSLQTKMLQLLLPKHKKM